MLWRSWRRREALVTARSIGAEFFFRLVSVIALAQLAGSVESFIFAVSVQEFSSILFLEANSVATGLGTSGLLAAFRRPVLQVGPSNPPTSSSVPTLITAVAIQVVIRRERAIAPLE